MHPRRPQETLISLRQWWGCSDVSWHNNHTRRTAVCIRSLYSLCFSSCSIFAQENNVSFTPHSLDSRLFAFYALMWDGERREKYHRRGISALEEDSWEGSRNERGGGGGGGGRDSTGRRRRRVDPMEVLKPCYHCCWHCNCCRAFDCWVSQIILAARSALLHSSALLHTKNINMLRACLHATPYM